MQSYFELGDDEKTRRMSPWLLRIELNRCAAAGSLQSVPTLALTSLRFEPAHKQAVWWRPGLCT